MSSGGHNTVRPESNSLLVVPNPKRQEVRMDSRLILVTGGARSGKSNFAESLLREQGSNVLYVATAVPIDEEMKDRIKRHRKRRPIHWRTLEGYAGLGGLIKETRLFREAVLLDCLTVMVTNLLMDNNVDFDHLTPEAADEIETSIAAEVSALLDSLQEIETIAVVVTNEIGLGLVPDNPMGRFFRDVCGRMNQMVAARADEVYLVVCGLPLRLK